MVLFIRSAVFKIRVPRRVQDSRTTWCPSTIEVEQHPKEAELYTDMFVLRIHR